jgi:hypothetical protein
MIFIVNRKILKPLFYSLLGENLDRERDRYSDIITQCIIKVALNTLIS